MNNLFAPIPAPGGAPAAPQQQQPQQGQPQMQQTGYRGGGVGAPPPQPQAQGSIKFVLKDDQGAEGSATDATVMQALATAGYNPQQMSPDGMTVTLQDTQGAYTVRVEDALKNMGWQVHQTMPLNVDYSQVNSNWRAKITGLPQDDDVRRAYIEGQYRKTGQPMPQIIGSGRDWYAFNPGTNQWQAITNNPEWDLSDAAEAAVHAPRMIGSTLGVLGGVPGVLAGGTGGDIATRLLLAANDDVYADVASGNLGKMAMDVGINTAVDAGTLGLAKGGGALVQKFAPGAFNTVRNVATAGPLSTGMKMAGGTMEAAGGITKAVGQAADSHVGRQVMSYMNPLTSGPMMAADLAQLPGQMIRGGAAAPGFLAKQGRVRMAVGSKRAHGMRDYTDSLTKERGPANWAEETAARFGRPVPEHQAGARHILPNMVERHGINKIDDQATRDMYRAGRMAGKSDDEIFGEMLEQGGIKQNPMAGNIKWQKRAEGAGKFIDQVEQTGKAVENVITGAHGAVAKGIKGAGTGMQYGGRAMNRTGTVMQPVEAYNWGRMGAEETYGDWMREQAAAWRPKGNRARMSEEILAQNRK